MSTGTPLAPRWPAQVEPAPWALGAGQMHIPFPECLPWWHRSAPGPRPEGTRFQGKPLTLSTQGWRPTTEKAPATLPAARLDHKLEFSPKTGKLFEPEIYAGKASSQLPVLSAPMRTRLQREPGHHARTRHGARRAAELERKACKSSCLLLVARHNESHSQMGQALHTGQSLPQREHATRSLPQQLSTVLCLPKAT